MSRKKLRPHSALALSTGELRHQHLRVDNAESNRSTVKSVRSDHAAKQLDFVDFSADIFSDSGWDTDLEPEGEDLC